MIQTEKNKKNSYMYGNGVNILGVEKKNAVCAFVIVDENYNMYYRTPEGVVKSLYDLKEHNDRLELMSEGSEFYIDGNQFQAYGNTCFPYKYTRVYTDNPASLDKSKVRTNLYVKFHPFKDMPENLRSHEVGRKDTLFVVGGSQLLTAISHVVDKVFITRIMENVIPENCEVIDKFPVDIYKAQFKKREIQESEHAKLSAKLKSGMAPTDLEINMLSEHIRVIKRVKETPKKKISYIPQYRFEIFSK